MRDNWGYYSWDYHVADTVFVVLYPITTIEIWFLLFCEEHCVHYFIFWKNHDPTSWWERGWMGEGAIEEEGGYSLSQ